MAISYLLWSLIRRLDTIPTFDHIRLQTNRTRTSMKFEEKTTGITKHWARLIASPQWCRWCLAVLTYWLCKGRIVVSQWSSHDQEQIVGARCEIRTCDKLISPTWTTDKIDCHYRLPTSPFSFLIVILASMPSLAFSNGKYHVLEWSMNLLACCWSRISQE